MRFFNLLALCFLLFGAGSAHAARFPVILATNKPLQSLVMMVTQGNNADDVSVIGMGNFSEHANNFRPSDAEALEKADVIVRTSKYMETWLNKPLMRSTALIITMDELPGINLLPARNGGLKTVDEHEYHGEDDGHDHENATHDPHVWLDIRNAIVLLEALSVALQAKDPANAELYSNNTYHAIRDLRKLDEQITTRLSALKEKPFVVYHDAYQYFEQRYGMKAVGAIAVHAGQQPSAARLAEIRNFVKEEKVTCVFAEPQFNNRVVDNVLESVHAHRGSLDPIGLGIENGRNAYMEMMEALSKSMAQCLSW